MVQRICLFLVFGLFSHGLFATDLFYRVSFEPVEHYIQVELSASELQGDCTLLKMPVWAPGYYLIVDYPKNLVGFAATDLQGRSLSWEKQGKSGWLVKHSDTKEFRVSYRIYANAQSVAESMVTVDKAFVVPNGVFMYVEGEKQQPVTVAFRPDASWKKVSTGLEPVAGELFMFRASDIDNLYDCPVYIGNHRTIDFELDGRSYQLALETPEGLEKTTFVEDLKKVITTSTAIFGDVPYQHYCFILMGAGGGGLEHLNSQACFTSGSFFFKERGTDIKFMAFITHEFFHLYNVKSIRPVEFGPFDYEREVFTPSLWISEGFTVYYETVLLRRAKIIDSEVVLDYLSNYIRTVESAEGRKYMSLRQSSYDIWLNFFNRNANGKETRISYYDKGPILGLLMDIEIRRLTNNRKSLDDVMYMLYHSCFREKGCGFTEAEFWKVCETIAGSPLEEIRKYVDTTCEIDYLKYLGYAGLVLGSDWQLQKKECTGIQKVIQDSIL